MRKMQQLNLNILFEKTKKTKKSLEFVDNKTEKVNSVNITIYNDEQLYNKIKYLEADFISPLLTKIYSLKDQLFFGKLRNVYIYDERSANIDSNLKEIDGIEKARYNLNSFFENLEIYDFLNNIPRIERQKTIEIINKYNANELLHFLQTIKANSKITNKRKLYNIAIDIKNHKFIKTVDISKQLKPEFKPEIVCQQTYGGFLRALKTNTLIHITAEINGRPKALFVKTQIGELPFLKQYSKDPLLLGGYNVLAIDPENLNVYSFKTLKSGKIDHESIKQVMDYKNLENYLKHDRKYLAQEARTLAKKFQKELYRKLDKMYHKAKIPGTQRIKKTYERFKVKPK
jgi:hypothetical protein